MKTLIEKLDLEHVAVLLNSELSFLKNRSLFLTGGTGFFGKWLLEVFNFLNENHNLQLKITVLSRNPEKFKSEFPWLSHSKFINFLSGDVKSFIFPSTHYDFLIHAATEASEKLNSEFPFEMLSTTIQGTEHTLNFAKERKIKRYLLTSSGAVYGKIPSEISHVTESYMGGPDTLNPRMAYSEGKRVSELMCSIANSQRWVEPVMARCFAFVGPYLPVEAHFAIGNFIRDCILGKNIEIKGDGTPFRSYLYASDLTVWIIKLLIHGKPGQVYNVGSDFSITIKQLAERVLAVWEKDFKSYHTNTTQIQIAKDTPLNNKPEQFVPSIAKASEELDLKVYTSLDQAIRKTFHWNLQSRTKGN